MAKVDTMNSEKHGEKVLLASNDTCRVEYCPGCRVAEVSVGPLSMRFDSLALRTLAMTLAGALYNLDRLHVAPAAGEHAGWVDGNVH